MRKQLNTYYKHDQNHGEEMRREAYLKGIIIEVTTTTTKKSTWNLCRLVKLMKKK